MRDVQIPAKRLPVLIAKNKALLKELTNSLGVKFKLKKDGMLELTGPDGDAGKEWEAEQVINAVALGFEPPIALKMLDDKNFLETLNLQQAFRGKDKLVERYKGRVIGSQGLMREKIEHLTGCHLAISDNEISFIGEWEDLKIAKEAVLKLLEGGTHSGALSYLEKQAKKRKYLIG